MKILYLTPAWYGFKEIIFDGEISVNGLPSFTFPLKGLISQGHTVDFVILHTEKNLPNLNIKVDWLKDSSFKAFCYYDLKMPNKILSIIKYRKVVSDVLSHGNYDFVYAHGTSTALVRSVVNKFNIPFAQRLYGTFLWDKMESLGYIHACVRHLVEYLSFKTKKKFLLVTNDGSRGDLVYQKLFPNNNSPYEFFYWKNGVSRYELSLRDIEAYKKTIKSEPFIFYCARFDDWKRQDRVLNIIYELKQKGILINCYFAGPFDTLGDRYFQYIKDLAEELGISTQVIFMGAVDKKAIYIMNKLALASISLYDVCNLTNVFHEMMSSGALIIVKDDEPIKEYIVHGYNGFLVRDDAEVVNILEELFNSPDNFSFMRNNVIQTSLRLTKNWDERVQQEIELILKM